MSLLGEGTLWVLGAAALGYSISALFSGVFRLRRSTYLLAYIPLAGAFSVTYFQTSAVNVLDLVVDAWPWGLLGAGVVGSLAIKNVLSQPSSPRSTGGRLVMDLLWPGFLYGLVDGVLLSVLPILAITGGFSETVGAAGWPGSLTIGISALLASLFVTSAYHLGYSEFRGTKPLLGAMIGNGLFSAAFLVTGNPLAAVLPHIAMHMTAIVHGKDTTLQLPPHDPSPTPNQGN